MSTEKITQTLQRIRNDRSLEDYFFKKLAGASKPIEWLSPLKDAGYFNPQNNPKPQEVSNKPGYFTIPHWNILNALENMALKNEETPDDRISRTLLEIVDNIISYREEGKRIDNYRTDWKILEILSHLPIQYLGMQHIEFIKDALNPSIGSTLLDHEIGRLFFPKLVRERNVGLILHLMDIILDYSKPENCQSREYVSVIDSYYLKEALDNNKKGISELCPIEAANVAISKMKQILQVDKSQFNCIWIPAIEDHPQTTFPDHYECQIVHFVRDMLQAADPVHVKPIVKDMLAKENDIFKRLAFHLINHHYNSLSELLWTLPYNPLSGLTIHEFYELLSNHCSVFDEQQMSTVLNWIETQEFYYSDEVQEDQAKKKHVEAYYKKEWLLALMGSGSDEVKQLYQLYDGVNNAPIDHPGFHNWSSGVGLVKDISPIEEEEFKKKNNQEIAEYINTYTEQDDISWKDFTRVNLASSVRKFVSNDPERYCKDMSPFLNVPLKYKYELLRGFEEAWRNNKDFNWEELLVFAKGVLGEPRLFDATEEEEDKYNHWIIDTVADLIHEGTKDDKHALPLELMVYAEEILLILLENVKFGMNHVNDMLTSFLNSSKGKVFMAAINYSLRYARQLSGGEENKWVQPIKDDFTRRLNKSYEPGLEFSVAMGSYLPNLHYLDKDWIESNINKIFDSESDKHWEAAITGHIVMTSTVYEEIYKLLRSAGHYEKALLYNFADSHVGDKLVQNISIGYVAGWDDLANDTGLMYKLLEGGNAEYLSNLVTFMWTFRERRSDVSLKIKPLWAAVINKVAEHHGEERYQKILSDLGRWFSLVDNIDEEVFTYIKESLPFIEINWNSSEIIKNLARHVINEPFKVGELFLLMLATDNYPSYKKEDIVKIVQTLYGAGLKETANKICNMYYVKGFEFLRKTFETNN